MEAEGTSGAGEILEVLEVWPPDHCLEDQAEAETEAGTVEETVEDVVGAGGVEDSSYMAFDIKICYFSLVSEEMYLLIADTNSESK